jgi:hypothetical protein
MIRQSTANLLRSISRTKLMTEEKTTKNSRLVSGSKVGLLRRELELLSEQIIKQKETIN